MADFENIASACYLHRPTIGADTDTWVEQFVEFYYKTFDGADRTQLAALYGNDSMLTFEAAPCQGVGNIIQKLQVSGLSPTALRCDRADAEHVLSL